MSQLRPCIFACVQVFGSSIHAQNSSSPDFRKYDAIPVISYSPETQLELGVIGYRYLDFSRNNPETTRSFIRLIGLYSTNNQILFETGWELFTDGGRTKICSRIFSGYLPGQSYGGF